MARSDTREPAKEAESQMAQAHNLHAQMTAVAAHSWDPPEDPVPGHKLASPEDRMAAALAVMQFKQGMHADIQEIINDVRKLLDFAHDKSP